MSASEPSVFGLDSALGLVGLPGLSSPADDDESTYEKAWRMQDGPNGTTRLTYGERYRRNPDGLLRRPLFVQMERRRQRGR